MTHIAYCRMLLLCCFSSCLFHSQALKGNVNLQPEGEYAHVCLGDSFEATCTSQTAVLGWVISLPDHPTLSYFFTIHSNLQSMVGNFTFTLVPNDLLVSRVSLSSAGSDHNGTVLTCLSTIVTSPQSTDITNITLIVLGPPMAPISPEFAPQSLTSAVLFWTPPNNSVCVTSYTITLTNISEGNVSYIYNTTTNTTSKTVSDLSQGTEYSFTVAGFDAGGRVGEKSVSAEVITLDTPEKVTELRSCVSSSAITVTWMPPPPSSRPPVTGYKIIHNTTGSTSVQTNLTNDTNFTIENIGPGVYLFNIQAVNAVGDGEENILVEILTSPLTTAVAKTTIAMSKSIGITMIQSFSTPEVSFINNLSIESVSVYSTLAEATPGFKDLSNIFVPLIITSISILVITTTVILFCILTVIVKKKLACPKQALAKAPQDNLTCSENVAYESVNDALKMFHSENVAYDITVKQTREDTMRNTATGYTAVYDEVSFKKF